MKNVVLSTIFGFSAERDFGAAQRAERAAREAPKAPQEPSRQERPKRGPRAAKSGPGGRPGLIPEAPRGPLRGAEEASKRPPQHARRLPETAGTRPEWTRPEETRGGKT